jgi:hypothetical protein
LVLEIELIGCVKLKIDKSFLSLVDWPPFILKNGFYYMSSDRFRVLLTHKSYNQYNILKYV